MREFWAQHEYTVLIWSLRFALLCIEVFKAKHSSLVYQRRVLAVLTSEKLIYIKWLGVITDQLVHIQWILICSLVHTMTMNGCEAVNSCQVTYKVIKIIWVTVFFVKFIEMTSEVTFIWSLVIIVFLILNLVRILYLIVIPSLCSWECLLRDSQKLFPLRTMRVWHGCIGRRIV